LTRKRQLAESQEPEDPDQRSIAGDAAGRDLTRYCAAACDLNHAGTPHVPWDCNAPEGSPTLGEADRRVLAELDEARLPWVRYATPLLLSAGEVQRLRGPITAAMLRLQVDEDARDLPAGERLSEQLRALDQRLIRGQHHGQGASVGADVPARLDCPDANRVRELLGDAARRLDDQAHRRAAADPPYLVGPEDFTNLAGQLRAWCAGLLSRQQHPLPGRDQAVAVALDTPERHHPPAREQDHER
jgi:hypothetical protein